MSSKIRNNLETVQDRMQASILTCRS